MLKLVLLFLMLCHSGTSAQKLYCDGKSFAKRYGWDPEVNQANKKDSISLINRILEFYNVTFENVGMYECLSNYDKTTESVLYICLNDNNGLQKIQQKNLPEGIKNCGESFRGPISFNINLNYASPNYIIAENVFYKCLPTKPFGYTLIYFGNEKKFVNSHSGLEIQYLSSAYKNKKTLVCTAIGNIVTSTLNWTCPEGVDKTRLNITEMYGQSFLQIQNFTTRDEGVYKCFVSESSQSGINYSHFVYLNLRTMNQAYLRATMNNYVASKSFIFKWINRDGHEIKDSEFYKILNEKCSSTLFVFEWEMLLGRRFISEIRDSQSGEYVSKITYDYSHEKGTFNTSTYSPHIIYNNTEDCSSNYNIEDNERINIRLEKGDGEIIEGDEVNITCVVLMTIPFYHFKWFHNEQLIVSRTDIKFNNQSKSDSTIMKLNIPRIEQKHTGSYKCQTFCLERSVNITVQETMAPTLLSSWYNNSVLVKDVGDLLFLNCSVIAYPRPKVSWCQKVGENDWKTLTGTTFFIQTVKLEAAGVYKCVAENRIHRSEYFLTLELDEPIPLYLKIFVPIIVIFIILSVILSYYFAREYRERKQLTKLLESLKGDLAEINPALPLTEQTDLLVYDKKFEFPRNKLKLGKQLGAGTFGVVMEGEAEHIKRDEEKTKVAVKMSKRSADNQALHDLVSEIKILIHVGKHLNIVNFLGAVTKNIASKELMVIMEFCPYGSVDKILRENRSSFINLINGETDKIDTTFNQINSDTDDLIPKKLNTLDLVSWSYQVACGMNFLSSKRVIHGDLAARNLLLSENNVVKICDFGLANSLEDKNYYRTAVETRLPIKWLALETLQDNKFTTYTDIWSYGIVLWELFSLAETPYEGMHVSQIFCLRLEQGYRLEKPPFANNKIYNIMLKCWQAEPIERPLFIDLMRYFAEVVTLPDSKMVINKLYSPLVP